MLCPNLPVPRKPAVMWRMETGTVCSHVPNYVFTLYYSSHNASLLPLSTGVMQWVTQGLTKVLPQPDDKYKETKEKQEEHTEVSYKLKSATRGGPAKGAAK